MARGDFQPSQQLRTLESKVINLFLFIYLEREHGWGCRWEREKLALRREPDMELNPRIHGS